jgi:hypothetical protein
MKRTFGFDRLNAGGSDTDFSADKDGAQRTVESVNTR